MILIPFLWLHYNITETPSGLGHMCLQVCVCLSKCVWARWSQLSNEAISGQAAAAGRRRKQLQSLRPIICLVLITITRVRSTCCCRCGHRDVDWETTRDHEEPGGLGGFRNVWEWEYLWRNTNGMMQSPNMGMSKKTFWLFLYSWKLEPLWAE